MVTLKSNIPEDRSFDWTESLLSHVHPSEMIILDCGLKAKYHEHVHDTSNPILLKCETSLQKKLGRNDKISYVQAPYLIEGVTASLLSQAQVMEIPATALLSFVHQPEACTLDEIMVFDKCLCSLPNPVVDHDRSKLRSHSSTLLKYQQRFTDVI
jgi:hypothetical protein